MINERLQKELKEKNILSTLTREMNPLHYISLTRYLTVLFILRLNFDFLLITILIFLLRAVTAEMNPLNLYSVVGHNALGSQWMRDSVS